MDVLPRHLFVRRPPRSGICQSNGRLEVSGSRGFQITPRNRSGTLYIHDSLDAAKDLRLDSAKEYIVYEFWTKKLIGTFKGTFTTRPLSPYDCDIYNIVEKQDGPYLFPPAGTFGQMRLISRISLTMSKSGYEGNFTYGRRGSVTNSASMFRMVSSQSVWN